MKKIITIARLKQIASAIRSKTKKTDLMTLDEMPIEINSIDAGLLNLGAFGALTVFIPTSITQEQWDAGYMGMKQLLTSAQVTSLTFNSCSNLTDLDLSFWDGGKRTSLRGMFSLCQKLKTLDLSNFNTSEVTSMRTMFQSCQNLTIIDVSSFDTRKVTEMDYMFNNCSAVKTLDLSNFNTSAVKTLSSMFYSCNSLTSLDLSSFNTENVTNMRAVFSGCSSLTVINWPTVWSLAKYTNIFDLSYCPLNHDSCLTLFNALADCSDRTVKLSLETKGYMSDAEIKIATDKGVTIA